METDHSWVRVPTLHMEYSVPPIHSCSYGGTPFTPTATVGQVKVTRRRDSSAHLPVPPPRGQPGPAVTFFCAGDTSRSVWCSAKPGTTCAWGVC